MSLLLRRSISLRTTTAPFTMSLLAMMAGCGSDTTGESWDYEDEVVALDSDLVIASGETLRVGPGTTFNASEGVTIRVEGTLFVEGTTSEPVRFLGDGVGDGVPRSWEGIVIEDGGMLELAFAQIGGATYGIHARPGSDFVVTRADIGTSFKAALVESDGAFDHVAFHASGDEPTTFGELAPEVDPDGALAIINGSPSVSHSTFDGSHAFSDMVRIRGTSAATFDHVHITEAHCGFHVQDTPNNSPRMTNSVMLDMAFGIMAYAGKPVMEGNVFQNNQIDVGFCYGATEENTPDLRDNFYSSGALILDAPCARINTVDASPATVANPEAGPVGAVGI